MYKFLIYKFLNKFIGNSKEFQIELNKFLKSKTYEKDKAIKALGVRKNKGEKDAQN